MPRHVPLICKLLDFNLWTNFQVQQIPERNSCPSAQRAVWAEGQDSWLYIKLKTSVAADQGQKQAAVHANRTNQTENPPYHSWL